MSIKRMKQFRIYKPNNSGNGAASAFQVKIEEHDEKRIVSLFLVCTSQTGKDDKGNAAFSWKDVEKSVTLKLGQPDVGEILSVINGKKVAVGNGKGLFHANQKGSTSLNFSQTEYGYSLRANKKIGNVVGTPIQHSITIAEGEILKVLLEDFISLTYNWLQ